MIRKKIPFRKTPEFQILMATSIAILIFFCVLFYHSPSTDINKKTTDHVEHLPFGIVVHKNGDMYTIYEEQHFPMRSKEIPAGEDY